MCVRARAFVSVCGMSLASSLQCLRISYPHHLSLLEMSGVTSAGWDRDVNRCLIFIYLFFLHQLTSRFKYQRVMSAE